MTEKAIYDPALYERMSEPYTAMDEASAALSAFHDDVRTLRRKHRIANTVVIASVQVDSEGAKSVVSRSFNGAECHELPLLAWAMGVATADRDAAPRPTSTLTG